MQQTEILELFGQRVANLRAGMGMNQAALANRLGEELGKKVDPTTITRMERGSRPTSVIELYCLANIFGVSVGDLLPGAGGSPTEAAAQQLESAVTTVGRERMLAVDHVRALEREYERVRRAAAAADRLRMAARTNRSLTEQELSDLECLARLGFGTYLKVHFLDILTDFLTDPKNELSAAQEWSRNATPEELGLTAEEVSDEVLHYLGLIDYLRHERDKDAPEA
ncbi:helix-turn-helix transcriptional regulator [Rhodococcus aetherivorans]|uniref:helix-turn-helix domain-containing protein n=1 Tax=Rhodococcus aetherivorans TaxID=191292 RepID=UPI00160DF99E|nr:helix-turn-helix transcriptional regulator [Rhodococcus aetherivorans]